MGHSAMFYDGDMEAKLEVVEAMDEIERYLEYGKFVYWPKDGIGTGLARWQQNAPNLLKWVEERAAYFLAAYGEYG